VGKLETCFNFTMSWEGGARYTNDPRDPGGPTKYGVSLKHSAALIGDKDADGDIDADDVQLLTLEDAQRIFRLHYFAPMRGDDLPLPIALMAVDYAYNSGQHAAVIGMQHVLGTAPDGKIGPKTIAEARFTPIESFVNAYAAARLTYLQGLATWATFGRGWTRRVMACRDLAARIAR
jgi:lysozyme family protein